MTYRVLVDENTSITVVELLRDAGHEAVHVTVALEEGVTDEAIVEYARDRDSVVLTHDPDFLDADVASKVPVLYYSDDTLGPSTIADRIDQLVAYVPDQRDLPPVTNIGVWS